MPEPKPIKLTQVDADAYTGPEPKPYVVVGPIPGGGGSGAVDSVNGKTGTVVLSASDVGAAGLSSLNVFTNTNIFRTGLSSVGSLFVIDSDTGATIATKVTPTDFQIGTAGNPQAYLSITKTGLTTPVGEATYPPEAGVIATQEWVTEQGGGGAVSSVNTQTGDVVLDASDVGAYALPEGGIPATDLASAVQTSLGKADSALQAAPVTSVAAKTGTVTLVKADVGLDEVDNTADLAKPISTATQTALDAKVPTTRTVSGHALTADLSLVKGDVGLGMVDNTPDASKPVSTATQSALDAKVATTRTVNGHALSANVTLTASDVSAVPTSRTINGHALSSDATVTKDDIGLSLVQNLGVYVIEADDDPATLGIPAGSAVLRKEA